MILAAVLAMHGSGDGSPMARMHGPMWMPMQPPTAWRVLDIHLQPIPVLPAGALAILLLYLAGVAYLHHRGDHWPLPRTIWWGLGVFSILLVTATGMDGYGMELFSVHMIQHMTLSMLTPVLLVLGAPVTLLLRVLPAGHGRFNARHLLLRVLHSRFARLVTHPLVTVSAFLLSLYGLYFTPIFDFLMDRWWGHNLMLIHFVLIGMLYYWGVLDVDPSPRRNVRGIRGLNRMSVRLFELFATLPFHAFFGVVVMMSTFLIVGYYRVPMPGWGISPLSDQRVGGGIAWAATEFPTLIILGALAVQWQRAEVRRDRAIDRKVAREGDVDLDAYNRYLTALSQREPR